MLTRKDISQIFECLKELGLNYRFGYAGSYARGAAKNNSDLDIVVEGATMLSGDEYMKIYNQLKKLLHIRFDIVDLTALKEDDNQMDQMLLDMGLNVNESSAYKNMKKDAVWMC